MYIKTSKTLTAYSIMASDHDPDFIVKNTVENLWEPLQEMLSKRTPNPIGSGSKFTFSIEWEDDN